jgi:hypothetical protein
MLRAAVDHSAIAAGVNITWRLYWPQDQNRNFGTGQES